MEAANILVSIALGAFVPVVFACVAWLGPRRGVPASLLGGWLFLPSFDGWIDVPLVHTKSAFVPAVVLVASFVLDVRRWRGFHPRLLDARGELGVRRHRHRDGARRRPALRRNVPRGQLRRVAIRPGPGPSGCRRRRQLRRTSEPARRCLRPHLGYGGFRRVPGSHRNGG